jgi:hypothetical protein
LREAGYVEGGDIGSISDRPEAILLSKLAAELVALKVDVILA